MKKIGILYICTGKYSIFWKSFYESCEKFLLTEEGHNKHYFVFTDVDSIEFENKDNVNRIYQKPLAWPYITLLRFKIFNNSKNLYKDLDYLYFFNANMLLVRKITNELLPTMEQSLVFIKHPGFFEKNRVSYSYEKRQQSCANVKANEGQFYFMGGLNGGSKNIYLNMSEVLEKNIDNDLKKNIVAVWHDESHLNRFAIDNKNIIKILDPSYGYPEGWDLPFEAKIIIRDKNNFGGHDFLRNQNYFFAKILKKLF